MRVIILTRGQHTVVDDDVYEWASKFKWHGTKRDNRYYAVRWARDSSGRRKRLSLHQEILPLGAGKEVDHFDGDSLNNLRENLRESSRAENARNSPCHRDNASGVKGVSVRFGKFQARIFANGRHIHLGYFLSKIDAAQAYNAAAIKSHGAFARLNEIP